MASFSPNYSDSPESNSNTIIYLIVLVAIFSRVLCSLAIEHIPVLALAIVLTFTCLKTRSQHLTILELDGELCHQRRINRTSTETHQAAYRELRDNHIAHDKSSSTKLHCEALERRKLQSDLNTATNTIMHLRKEISRDDNSILRMRSEISNLLASEKSLAAQLNAQKWKVQRTLEKAKRFEEAWKKPACIHCSASGEPTVGVEKATEEKKAEPERLVPIVVFEKPEEEEKKEEPRKPKSKEAYVEEFPEPPEEVEDEEL